MHITVFGWYPPAALRYFRMPEMYFRIYFRPASLIVHKSYFSCATCASYVCRQVAHAVFYYLYSSRHFCSFQSCSNACHFPWQTNLNCRSLSPHWNSDDIQQQVASLAQPSSVFRWEPRLFSSCWRLKHILWLGLLNRYFSRFQLLKGRYDAGHVGSPSCWWLIKFVDKCLFKFSSNQE